jgi:hypothetical protein
LDPPPPANANIPITQYTANPRTSIDAPTLLVNRADSRPNVHLLNISATVFRFPGVVSAGGNREHRAHEGYRPAGLLRVDPSELHSPWTRRSLSRRRPLLNWDVALRIAIVAGRRFSDRSGANSSLSELVSAPGVPLPESTRVGVTHSSNPEPVKSKLRHRLPYSGPRPGPARPQLC